MREVLHERTRAAILHVERGSEGMKRCVFEGRLCAPCTRTRRRASGVHTLTLPPAHGHSNVSPSGCPSSSPDRTEAMHLHAAPSRRRRRTDLSRPATLQPAASGLSSRASHRARKLELLGREVGWGGHVTGCVCGMSWSAHLGGQWVGEAGCGCGCGWAARVVAGGELGGLDGVVWCG